MFIALPVYMSVCLPIHTIIHPFIHLSGSRTFPPDFPPGLFPPEKNVNNCS